MQYQVVAVTAFQENCSLIWCEKSNEGALVDPGGDVALLKQAVARQGFKVSKILLTHGHLDHVGAAKELADFYQVPIIGPAEADRFLFELLPQQSMQFGFPYCAVFEPNQWLTEGEHVQVGQLTFDVLGCPGHTPGHIVFIEKQARIAFVGDVLFLGGVGRTDFPRGNHHDLMCSIKDKLLPLGDDITFVPGHGPLSTFGHERLNNPFILQSY